MGSPVAMTEGKTVSRFRTSAGRLVAFAAAATDAGIAYLGIPFALAAITLWVHLYQFSAALNWDPYVWMIAGKYMARGAVLYRDFWEMKPPGVFWYLSAVFSVLPTAVWSVRIADFCVFLIGAAAFYRLCRVETGRILAVGGTGVWLFFAHHPVFDLGGVYTEQYMVICEVIAVLAAVFYRQSGLSRAALLSGLATSAAVLCKHPGGVAAVPALMLIAARPTLRAFSLFFAGLVAPIAATVAGYWALGALPQFLDCNLWFLIGYGRFTGPSDTLLRSRLLELVHNGWPYFTRFPVLIAALVAGVPVCVFRPTLFRLAALVWLLLDLLGIAVQGRFMQHYYIQMFHGLALVGALGASAYVKPGPAEHWSLRGARLLLFAGLLAWTLPLIRQVVAGRATVVQREWKHLLSGPGAWRQNPGEPFEDEVGAYIRERTSPDDQILMHAWAGKTSLGIYWSADRRPASRYFYPNMVKGTRIAEQLAELEQTRPAYVLIEGKADYVHLTPWLTQHYFLEAVRTHRYTMQLWARLLPKHFSEGTSVRLVQDATMDALRLEAPPTDPAAATPGQRLAEPRRGTWTSPALPVRKGDSTVHLDWTPRSNVAGNPTGQAFPRVDAPHSFAENEVRTVLGTRSLKKTWTTWPRKETQPMTVSIGHRAMVNRVAVVPARDAAGQKSVFLVELQGSDAGAPGGGPCELAPIPLTRKEEDDTKTTYWFEPRPLTALRLLITPPRPDTPAVVERVAVHTAGMGIKVRYRSGPTQELTDVPWVELEDTDAPLNATANGFVQVQCELWSEFEGLSPVLRYVQVGSARFRP